MQIISPADRQDAVDYVSNGVLASIQAARASDTPFYHLEFDGVFPDDIYATLLAAMPSVRQYRPMSGTSERRARLYKIAPVLKSWGADLPKNMYVRVRVDLYPEIVRLLLPEQRPIWDVVSRALCSQRVKAALIDRLAPGLEVASERILPRSECTRAPRWYGMFPVTS